MIITRTSFVSGIERSMTLNITPEQIKRHDEGVLVQDAFPHLSPDEREFYMTGVTPEEWGYAFGEEGEDDG